MGMTWNCFHGSLLGLGQSGGDGLLQNQVGDHVLHERLAVFRGAAKLLHYSLVTHFL